MVDIYGRRVGQYEVVDNNVIDVRNISPGIFILNFIETGQSVRFHMSFGISDRYKFDQKYKVKALEFYIETTTNDLYMKYYI